MLFMEDKEVLVLPNILLNSIYVEGLSQPLDMVADILDEQDKSEFALALRYASIVCKAFCQINILETHKLVK